MRRDLHNLDVGDVKEKQRFSIRKLTVGTASVLLGTTFLFGAGQTAYADTTASGAITSEDSQNQMGGRS